MHTLPKLCVRSLGRSELPCELVLTKRGQAAAQKHFLHRVAPSVDEKKMLLSEAREDLGS